MKHVLVSPVACQTAVSVARICRPTPLRRKLVVRRCLKASSSATVQRTPLRANGLDFVLDDQGDKAATPVILLHGFPNRGNLWERQIPSLLDEGFRVITPDLRGAVNGESDAPRNAKDYRIPDVLVKDVAGILDALEIKKAHIVGHDWGSSLAWAFAALYPERTLQLVGMSVGNPVGYMKGPHAAEQRRKAWYMLLFELRGIAESLLASGKLFAEGVGPPEAAAVEKEMLEGLGMLKGMDQPDNWTTGLNWYRANAGLRAFVTGSMFKIPHVTCDTLQLWFTGDDPVCSEGQAKSSGAFVDAPGRFRYERIQSLSHFAPWTDPEPVAASLKNFLSK